MGLLLLLLLLYFSDSTNLRCNVDVDEKVSFGNSFPIFLDGDADRMLMTILDSLLPHETFFSSKLSLVKDLKRQSSILFWEGARS